MAELKVAPNSWTPFLQNAVAKTENILSMGLVQEVFDDPITEKGKYFSQPYQKDITTRTSAGLQAVTSSDSVVTAKDVADFSINYIVVHGGDAIKGATYDDVVTGKVGFVMLSKQIAEQIAIDYQNYLISTLKGSFASALDATHVKDYHQVTDGALNAERIIRAPQEVLGEQFSDISTVAVNSQIYADLLADGHIQYRDAGTFGQDILYKGLIPVWLGKRIMINDTLCASYTHPTSGETVYPSYAMGGQPFRLSHQRKVTLYSDFLADTGRGTNRLFWYVDFSPAIKGVSWKDTASVDPVLADLETGSKWELKARAKDVKIIKLVTKSNYTGA